MARRDSSSRSKHLVRGSCARVPALTVSRPVLLRDGRDQDFRRLIHGLLAFFARHSALREGHGAFVGLTGIEYATLISVRHLSAGGEVGVIELAKHLHLSGAFTSTIINRLLIMGLISKETHPRDRRRVLLDVTSAGSDLLDKLAPTQMQVNDIQFGVLGEREFELLLSLTERLVKSSDEAIALQNYLLGRRDDSAVECKNVASRKERLWQ